MQLMKNAQEQRVGKNQEMLEYFAQCLVTVFQPHHIQSDIDRSSGNLVY